jgi:hypothetical protein
VRQSVHRLSAAGYTAQALHPARDRTRARSRTGVDRTRVAGPAPSRGFAMALDALFRLEDEDALFVIGRGPDGEPEGSCTSRSRRPGRRSRSRPCRACVRRRTVSTSGWWSRPSSWARAHGVTRSRSTSRPFAALLTPQAELSRLQRSSGGAAGAQGALPARQPAALQPQVLPELGAPVRRLRAPARPAAGRHRRARAEAYLPFSGRDERERPRARLRSRWPRPRPSTGASSPSTAPRPAPPLSVRGRRARSGCCSRTSAGSSASSPARRLGSVRRALALAPLSLVQAASAGGIGCSRCSSCGRRHVRSPPRAAGSARRRRARSCSGSRSPVNARTAALRRRPGRTSGSPARCVRPGSRRPSAGAPDSARPRVSSTRRVTWRPRPPWEGAAVAFGQPCSRATGSPSSPPARLPARGSARHRRRLDALTNALPILAGMLVFHEGLPAAARRVASRVRRVVVGAAAPCRAAEVEGQDQVRRLRRERPRTID